MVIKSNPVKQSTALKNGSEQFKITKKGKIELIEFNTDKKGAMDTNEDSFIKPADDEDDKD